ncbi:ATP-binding protein [Desulfococcaceae bacterium HSG8]|nr:ATP-binding protein [Desulfococcaceae bacterium HSG8]
MAHEINNPITSVILNTPILQKVWTSVLPVLDEHCQKYPDFRVGAMNYTRIRERIPRLLSDIADGARRVKDIVYDLRDFARERPSEMSDMVDVNNVVRKSAGLVSNLIRKSTDHFSVNYAPNLPVFRGNAQRIEQVVINLVMNACQSLSDSQHPVSVFTGYDTESASVFIEVRDEGCGIPPEVFQQIKDPFFTTRRDDGGTGLGLAISDRIIEDHGGTSEFMSAPGEGTTVRIAFPVGDE